MSRSEVFEQIAIVNRGEPAMRLIRAVREWNAERGEKLGTIALYTDPDREAQFVREADRAVLLGPAMFDDPSDPDEAGRPRRKSRYLDYAALRRALTFSRAEAAWVGWGFVAEHAAFAELCQELGVTFLGPSPESMRRLGDKIGSKLLAEQAGVPVAPWSQGPVATAAEARAHAERLGYPLLVKATAGGGGRGIRFVHAADQLEAAFASASAEARKSFGDPTVFLEKKVEGARHVEVQVLGDAHGTLWAAGVRDCTAQRCNQKVIEEAPAPTLTAEQDEALRSAAVRLGLAARYQGAGTVEFLFEPESGRTYFMEMNTRLQVEHPVTEATTGLDLVRLQIAIARGEKLPAAPPPPRGHAIEVRLCAEDPDRGFAPAPGRVASLKPALGPGLRVDCGVREGDRVPVEFDSMIAKIVATGATREEARSRLVRALTETVAVVEGGCTNRAFLLQLVSHPDFARAAIDTGWIDRLRQSAPQPRDAEAAVALLATALELHQRQLEEEELNFVASAGRGRPTLPPPQRRPIELRYGGQTYEFQVASLEPGRFRIQIDGQQRDVWLETDGPYEKWLCYRTHEARRRHRLVSVPSGTDYLVEVDGVSCRVERDQGGLVRAPAPGIVLAIHAAEGATVRAGERLLSLEAMKMEMPVTAPVEGRVRKVLVSDGVQVGAGDALLVLEPAVSAEAPDAPPAARLAFPGEDPSAPEPDHAWRAAARDLRRLMLGYDITEQRVGELLARFVELFGGDPPIDAWPCAGGVDGCPIPAGPAGLALIAELLEMYLEVESLFCKRCTSGPLRFSNDHCLQLFLRELGSEGSGLPEEFLAGLRRALSRHGVGGLGDSPGLRTALVRLFRSHQHLSGKNRALVALLQRCSERPSWRDAARTPEFRELLDRLVPLTLDADLRLCEQAQQTRYALFEGRAHEERRSEALGRAGALLERLRADSDGEERDAIMGDLVATPFALVGHLTPLLARTDERMRALVLEVIARRFYRSQSFSAPCTVLAGERVCLIARCIESGQPATALVTHAAPGELEPAIGALRELAAQLPAGSRALLDVFVPLPAAAEEVGLLRGLTGALAAVEPHPNVARVCASFAHAAPTQHTFTFAARDGSWREEEMLRGFHPSMGERLELWRLRNFNVRRVSTSEDLYLFQARARANDKDERLLAICELRQVHVQRDGAGRLVAVPEIDRALQLAFQAIREQQARRDARRRLPWNRVTLYVRPPVLARREEMLDYARRLLPWTRHLGLEKVSVRLWLQEASAQLPRDVVLSFSDKSGRLEMSVHAPHGEPLRALDEYALKLIRARSRGITYAYELVKLLAPPDPSDEMPAGRFEEYDLGSDGKRQELVSVAGRRFGENRANVVVGVVESFTPKHPDGMRRVLVVGDGTREMGALAEPECRRIIAALDLAQRLHVPLEWFPVSSGAKIAMDSGTENLDWTAAVLRRIVEFTQAGGEINVVVDGINVGAQSYWNAEATMLMHCRGCLIMTPRGAMLLTGKRALDYSGSVSAEDNQGIGGFERIMGPNGEAQYFADDIDEACRVLMRWYDHTYVAPGEQHPRRQPTADSPRRDVRRAVTPPSEGCAPLAEVFSDELNPSRKRPFEIRALMRAVGDQDCEPLERWAGLRDGESAVVWDLHLGGWPVCAIGIESRPLPRRGHVPSDGPESWCGGTLFPLSSKKVARAINAASGNRPVVVLANLSGFDGSPESLRNLQLEYGAEIGRAVVNFRGPLIFCVVARYHGGAYVVFSRRLTSGLQALAVEGSYASVIGGAAAAPVVFPEEARAATNADPRLAAIDGAAKGAARPDRHELYAKVYGEKLREIAERFDSIHTVQRARKVGSLDAILEAGELREALIGAVEGGLEQPWPEEPVRLAAATGHA